MLAASTYNNILVDIRQIIIAATGIQSELVINSNSLHGPDILNILRAKIAAAPTVDLSFIVFEMKERVDDSYGATSISGTKTEAIAPYEILFRIYGDNCHELSQKISTLFKLPNLVYNLFLKGAKITGTSAITNATEFINNVRWQRCDLQIELICRYEFDFAEDTVEAPVDVEKLTDPIEVIKF